MSRDAFTGRLGDALRAFVNMKPSSAEELSQVELIRPQLRSLVFLRLSLGHARMSDLAGYLGISLSSATSLADRLVSKGLVERGHDPADRRVVTCRLTQQGQDEVERFWWLGNRKAEAIAEALTDAELETVVHALEILSTALERRSRASASANTVRTSTGGPS